MSEQEETKAAEGVSPRPVNTRKPVPWYGSHRKVKPEILERREKVARFWNTQNLGVRETARLLECSPATVVKDRKWLLDRWQRIVLADVDEVVSREVAKLNVWETELFEAWEKSKLNVEIERTKKKRGRPALKLPKSFKGDKLKLPAFAVIESEHLTETRGRNADPRYMELLIKVQERRASMLGYDKQVKLGDALFSFASFVEEAHTKAEERRGRMPTPEGIDDDGSEGSESP